MRWVVRLLDGAEAGERRSYRLSVLLGLLAIGAGCALLATSGFLIARAAQRPAILSLLVAIVAVRAFALVRALARYGERLVGHDGALRTLVRLRFALYSSLATLLPGGLSGEAARRGELLSRYLADVDNLQDLYVRGLGPLLIALAVGAGGGVAIGLLAPAGGALFVALYGLAALLSPACAYRAASRYGAALQRESGRLTTGIVEAAAAAGELRLAGRAQERLNGLGDLIERIARASRRDGVATALAIQLPGAFAGLALVAVAGAAGQAVHGHRLSGVAAVAIALLANAAFEGVGGLAEAARRLGSWRGSAARLGELLEARPAYPDPTVPQRLEGRPTALCLEGLSFSHKPTEGPLLAGVSAVFAAGSLTVIEGPSGSGKTTLGLLCARFLAPSGGRIRLGEVDLDRLSGEEVRKAVLFLEADSHLYDTTVRDNLLVANPGACEQELWRALAAVGLADWLTARPEGLELAVGPAGGALSGGQRRRLIVARAALSEATFVIVDEPLAHLDEENGALVGAALAKLAREGKGVVALGHRLVGRLAADRAYRLLGGRLQRLG